MSLQFESKLEKSLKADFEVSQFDSNNKYRCEKCSQLTKAKHYKQLCALPQV